jgi:hypothetical protein
MTDEQTETTEETEEITDGEGTEALDGPVANAMQALVATDAGDNAMLFDHIKFNQAWRVSEMFASSAMVPDTFKKQPANVFVALNLANRLGVDPFQLMQNMYVVKGRPGIQAALLIAMVNARGPFEGPIQYEMSGKGKDRACTAFAIHKATGERCEMTVTWAMVEAEGWQKPKGSMASKWMTLPELMFRYRSAAFLARVYCPEVIMGLHSVEELDDIPNTVTATLEPENVEEQEKTTTRVTDAIKASRPKDKPKAEASDGTGSASMAMTRIPWEASSRAIHAAMVVLPTPPFPAMAIFILCQPFLFVI